MHLYGIAINHVYLEYYNIILAIMLYYNNVYWYVTIISFYIIILFDMVIMQIKNNYNTILMITKFLLQNNKWLLVGIIIW